MVKLLNKLKIGKKTYTLADSTGFVKGGTKAFGLEEPFYGGRITTVAKTDKEGVYLLLEGMEPIDIMIVEEEQTTDK